MTICAWLADRPRWFWLLAISLAFVIWSSIYIYRSSVIASDGQRYFVLIDDAMISMRYAWNLSHGRGLVWNEGVRVEGITNLLMTLYMAIWTAFLNKSLAVLMLRVSGVGFMLGQAYFTMKIAKELNPEWAIKQHFYLILIFGMSLGYYPMVFWTLFGMETGMMGLLLIAAAWVAIRYRNETTWQPWLGILLGLAFVTRPDSVVVGAIIYAYRLWTLRGKTRIWGTMGKEAGIWALCILGTTGFRWVYYGALVPNTYYLKVAKIPLLMRILNGLFFMKGYLYPIFVLVLIATLNVLINYTTEKLLLVTMFMGSVLYVIWTGGDGIGTHPRMVVPFMPMIMFLFVDGIAVNKALHKTIVLGLSGMFFLMSNEGFMDYILQTSQEGIVEVAEVNINMALALSQVTSEDASVAVFWAGTLPYYLDRTAVDLYGVSDSHIAHLAPDLKEEGSWWDYLPGHNKYDFPYSIDTLRPTFVEPWPSIMNWIAIESNAGSAYQLFEYHDSILLLDTESDAVHFDMEDLEPYHDDS